MANSRGGDSITQRIGLEGDDEVVRRLQNIEQAVQRIGQNQDALSGTVGAGFATLGEQSEKAAAGVGHLRNESNRTERDIGALGKSLERMNDQMLGVARIALPRLSEAFEVGIAAIVAAGLELAKTAANNITQMDLLSKATGFSTDAIGTLRRSFEDVGVDGNIVNDMLSRFSQHVGEAQTKSLQFNTAMTGGVTVLKGVRAAADAAAGSITVLRGKLGSPQGMLGDVSVLRGGVTPPAPDLNDPTQRFRAVTGKDINAYGNSQEENLRRFRDFIQGIEKLQKANQQALANAAGAAEFGERKWKEFGGIITEVLGKTETFAEKMHELKELGLLPTEEDKARAREYLKSVNELKDRWEAFGITILPAVSRGLNNINANVTNTAKAAPAFREMISSIWDTLKRGDFASLDRVFLPKLFGGGEKDYEGLVNFEKTIQDKFKAFGNSAASTFESAFTYSLKELVRAGGVIADIASPMIDVLKDYFSRFTDWLGPKLSSVWDLFTSAASTAITSVASQISTSLSNAASSVGSALGNLFGGSSSSGGGSSSGSSGLNLPAVPDYSAALSPTLTFAGGGWVPGSGLGDKVRSLLEPGEFVMNRLAVSRYGAGFFASLNGGYGLGGPRYAMGGIVNYPQNPIVEPRAGLTLVLGNDRFDFHGTGSSVDGLYQSATRSKMRRLGIRPSWNG